MVYNGIEELMRMSKTSSIYTRVEPEIKEQAEHILSTLGIPVTNAVNLFLHQVVLRKGIPFDIMLPKNMHANFASLTDEQFDTEMQKGFDSLEAERVIPSEQVRERMKRQYGVCQESDVGCKAL